MRSLLPASLSLVLVGAAAWASGCGGDNNASSGSASTGSATTGTSGTGGGGVGGAGTGGAGVGGMNTGGGGGVGGGTGGAGTGGAGTGGAGAGPTVIAECQGHVYQCGDLLDNDGDGLVDSQDPDCLGPCDNTEGNYYGGIPGQSGPACLVDCYFDQDSGAGNDGCYWNHKCDPHEVAPDYYPEPENGSQCAYNPNANTPGTSGSCDDLYMAQAQECYDFCGPLTPNGCDCFGCCELPAGSNQYVWLGSEDAGGQGSCSIADINDPTKCHPCLPVAACLNECGLCEICIGKPTVPPECNPSGGTGGGGQGGGGVGGGSSTSGSGGSGGGLQQCPTGIQPCGLPGQGPCPANYYCITGCCQEVPQ